MPHRRDDPLISMGKQVRALDRCVRILETVESVRASYSTANVSSPPTKAEVDAAFGTPEEAGQGFIGVINDNGANTTFWLCVAVASRWIVWDATRVLA